MKRTATGLRIQASYGIDPERCESLAEELANAWRAGWSACEHVNCDNCYSCGTAVDSQTNPYDEVSTCLASTCSSASRSPRAAFTSHSPGDNDG